MNRCGDDTPATVHRLSLGLCPLQDTPQDLHISPHEVLRHVLQMNRDMPCAWGELHVDRCPVVVIRPFLAQLQYFLPKSGSPLVTFDDDDDEHSLPLVFLCKIN